MRSLTLSLDSFADDRILLSSRNNTITLRGRPMNDLPSDKGFFEPTLWSTILKAQQGTENTRSGALGRLFERYRRPIILHIRHAQRCGELEAEEIAHEFMSRWMANDFLRTVDAQKGRFRTFVKTCLGNFLIDLARKRLCKSKNPPGGLASIDEVDPEGAPVFQVASEVLNPGEQLDVAWARDIVDRSMSMLERECIEARRGQLFSLLKPTLSGDPDAEQHAVIAAKLGTSEGAIKVAFHRLKGRLGEIIREEVNETLGSEEELEDELRHLIELLGK